MLITGRRCERLYSSQVKLGTAAARWIEAAVQTARQKKTVFTVLVARMGGGDGQGPNPRRVEKFSEVVRRVAPEGYDLAGHDGQGMFLVGLPGMGSDEGRKLAQRITSEMGTMYYGESTWCFVIAERDPGLPNWISTAGHRRGRIWFRWFLAEELPERPRSRVVKLSELGGA